MLYNDPYSLIQVQRHLHPTDYFILLQQLDELMMIEKMFVIYFMVGS